jgi:hypothetical protein
MINEYGGMIIGMGKQKTRRRRLGLIRRLELKESKILEADDPVLFQDTITKH